MTVNGKWQVACVRAVAIAGAPWLGAQGQGGQPGGGRAGGPGAGGPPAAPRASTLEHITVHGKSLEGNLEGDSPDREVTVYLPPTYAADPMRRFPVLYLLHGYGGRDNAFTDRLAHLKES